MRSDPQFHFFLFTCRDPDTDFRQPLVEALSAFGATTYVWLRRRPVVYDSSSGNAREEMSLSAFLAFMARRRDDGAIPVYFNSTNTYFPALTVVLRLIAPPGVWCFDVHDDLRYHNTGLKRIRENLIVKLTAFLSHEIVHAAPTLQRLLPRSKHLGNASHLRPLRLDTVQANAVLVIASFDERFDFTFLQTVARESPGLTFHLYGWVRNHGTGTQSALDGLVGNCPNVAYHGPYTMADLPEILARYKVTLAPYRTDTLLTEFIDPLRFYHCLNAGLEVVSTPIPQALEMGHYIHAVTDAASCSSVLTAILKGELEKQSHYSPITWEQKAKLLVGILHDSPRTLALASGREAEGVRTDP